MIGVFIQTGTGTAERKEKASSWTMAPYIGRGSYLLYEDNHGLSVVIKRHKLIPDAFEISKDEGLEVVINDERIFSQGDEGQTSELQKGVFLKKQTASHHPNRIIVIDQKSDGVEIDILQKNNGEGQEVARVKLLRVVGEEAFKILASEID